MDRTFMIFAALFGGLGVALGAFGAHALRERLPTDMLVIFETGVRYQIYHALALFGVILAITRWPQSSLPVAAGWLFVIGVVIFSGSLYILALSGARWWGAITPIGGVAFLAGWLSLLIAAVRN
jgi:uncharacterized membrane protein YgdD (TMEM256/DUF423 family)